MKINFSSSLILWFVFFLPIAIILSFFLNEYFLFQLSLVFAFAIAILGLNLLLGYGGQISLGHCAFFAIGGYTCAIVSQLTMNAFWSIPIAAIISFIFGFVIGFPSSRLEGASAAITTFGLAISTPSILKYFENWTGGVQGILFDPPVIPFFGNNISDQGLYFFILLILSFFFFITYNILKGRPGRAIMALRDNPLAAQAMGVNMPLYKSITFAISGLYTGVAGSLAALIIHFVSPDYYSLALSFSLVVGVVVGGLASIFGSLAGALFILLIPNFTDDISKAAPSTIFGIILILSMYFMPKGIAGLVTRNKRPIKKY